MMLPLRAVLALSVLLLLPGCLETPCSRHNLLCDGGPGGGDDDDGVCETFPQAAAGVLGPDAGATDVWALRVTDDFEDLQVRDDDGDWAPEARMWQDASDWDEGLDDCLCANPNGCPQVGVEVDEPGWVFVEVWDATGGAGEGRGYTLNAPGVQGAVLIRDAVPRADTPPDYGTSPPGLCERNRIGSDVQLPWFSEVESSDAIWLGQLEEPGLCVLGTIDGCTTDRDIYNFQKVGPNPTRLTLLFEPVAADLDVVMNPGGTGQTTDNPETILGSVPAGATADIEVTCQQAAGVTAYGLALETY